MVKVQASIVLEILGRPAEHIKSALDGLMEKLGSEKGVKIIDKIAHEPILAQDSKDLFTTFAEITLELDSLTHYLGILFAYMPAHTELIYPEKINFTNSEVNELANKLIMRLHEYDALTKKALVERDIIIKKLQEIAPHLFQTEQNIQQTAQAPKTSSFKEEKKSKKPKKKLP